MTNDIDLKTMTDGELTELRQQVTDEIARRAIITSAEKEAEHLAQRYQEAIGRLDGDAWVQPTGAHDAYAATAQVEHEGKLWESLVSGNVWEPGVSGWREVAEEGDTPPEWVQPTGAHDAYQKGDLVSFQGDVYESLIDANTWSPSAYPQGWKGVGDNA